MESEELVTELDQLRPLSPVCSSPQGTLVPTDPEVQYWLPFALVLDTTSRLVCHSASFALLHHLGLCIHLSSLTLTLSDQDMMHLEVYMILAGAQDENSFLS